MGEFRDISGELLAMVKPKIKSSAVSVSWRSGKLLKQIADRSEVEKRTSGGYTISISGPISTLKLQTMKATAHCWKLFILSGESGLKAADIPILERLRSLRPAGLLQ